MVWNNFERRVAEARSASLTDEASSGRVYDPKLARFVQTDPIVQDPRTTRSLNRYSYVWNNPLNATDPSGYIFSSIHRTRECETEKEMARLYQLV
ncbi:RHS repeat-associated core domain-containing protein [Marinimicrobium alkaliphilum]|uniref:RHS repeat-associated core domain-containing protein n=1 Tax=Marinimicrobium alkaliphilum TaxID=2202654 RepID=UPI000DB959C0